MIFLKSKSANLSLETINISDKLKLKHEFVLADQLLKCGTSVGANIAEAFGAQSTKDFVSKLNIAYKEILEAEYWVGILIKSDKFPDINFHQINTIVTELAKILTKSLKTAKSKLHHL